MDAFQYFRATDPNAAIAAAAKSQTAQQGASVRFIAGGTTLLDLMKLDVERPKQVVDINHLKLDRVEKTPEGGVKIGAMVRNSDLAHHKEIAARYPVLSQALLSGASAQLRNKATTGGNLLQRTRCMYFRDTAMPCNKREPGSGCGAIGGENRMLAIFGTSEHCIATNPSDMNVALAVLDAEIAIQGPKGIRKVAIGDFHLLPGSTPARETMLEPGDLITHVTLPPPVADARGFYLKLRDRASYEFALASAAVVMAMKDGKISHLRVAMGGIGTKPWRFQSVEQALIGKAPSDAAFRDAAAGAFKDARPQSKNGFKVELGRRCLVHALKTTAQLA
jgi:xanthine dehydrogenase YagS FAD-binding subunit